MQRSKYVIGGIDYGIENDHCGGFGTLYSRRPDLSQDQKPEEVIQRGRLCGAALYILKRKGYWLMKELDLKFLFSYP